MHSIPRRPRACRRTGRRRVLALAGLALLSAGAFLPGTSYAGIPPIELPPAPHVGQDPPHPPVDAQACLEKFLSSSWRCQNIWCHPASFMWFDWIDCDTSQLANCMEKVNQAFDCCMDPEHCPPDPPRTGS